LLGFLGFDFWCVCLGFWVWHLGYADLSLA